jgi:hypothetical protein
MAADPDRDTVVLFGGSDFSDSLGGTWTWSGKEWAEHRGVVEPPPREGAAFGPEARAVPGMRSWA